MVMYLWIVVVSNSAEWGLVGSAIDDVVGNEFRAVVEFALYQKIPKEHKTTDARQGTIDEDQDYLDFLESLKAEEKAQTELQNEPADGLTQIERLENRIAMVTGKMALWCLRKGERECVCIDAIPSQNVGC